MCYCGCCCGGGWCCCCAGLFGYTGGHFEGLRGWKGETVFACTELKFVFWCFSLYLLSKAWMQVPITLRFNARYLYRVWCILSNLVNIYMCCMGFYITYCTFSKTIDSPWLAPRLITQQDIYVSLVLKEGKETRTNTSYICIHVPIPCKTPSTLVTLKTQSHQLSVPSCTISTFPQRVLHSNPIPHPPQLTRYPCPTYLSMPVLHWRE